MRKPKDSVRYSSKAALFELPGHKIHLVILSISEKLSKQFWVGALESDF